MRGPGQIENAAVWLSENLDLVPPIDFSLIPSGRSNLTYEISDALHHRLVVRRPPVDHVLATAHDVEREYRFLTALNRTPVPVPAPIALCRDVSVIGVPFVVMEHVAGIVPRSPADVNDAWAGALGNDVIDTLVALHRIVPSDVGLEDLRRDESYVSRQLRRWSRQNAYMTSVLGTPIPLLDTVKDLLARSMPAEQAVRIVHGDYRPANLIVGPKGRVRAVLDWELAALGDPMCDLGHLVVDWAPLADTPDATSLASLPAWPTRRQAVERYARESGADLSNLSWYLAFALWRGASIVFGVLARYSTGAGGGDDVNLDWIRRKVTEALEASYALTQGRSTLKDLLLEPPMSIRSNTVAEPN